MRIVRLLAVALCIIAVFAAPALAGNAIKVGAILAVTGPASFLGAPEAKTLEMLVEDINAKGGVNGNKIELIIKDSGGSPEKAISFAKQLIEEEKVFAIIGPSTSGETMAIKNIAEDGKTILISCAAAEVIVNPVAKYVFKTPQKDSYAVIKIFEQMKKMGISKIGVLSSNTGFGKAGKEQIEKLAPENGIQILINEVYDKAATDLTAEVTKVKAANVQAIVNWSIEPAQAIVIKNARQIGMTVPIFQSHGFGNINYVQDVWSRGRRRHLPGRQAARRRCAFGQEPAEEAVLESYKKDYEAKYKEDVSTFGGHAYDAMILLERGIKNAGSADKEKVRTAIENIKGLVGTAGIFNMSRHGPQRSRSQCL